MAKKKLKTDEENKDLCSGCNGKCCRYVAMEIDAPENMEDMENIRWYVAHKNVHVYVEEDGTWNIEFMTPCEHLGENNLCMIYDKRPKICREYSQDDCPHHNDYEEAYTFETIEDVDKYIREEFLPMLEKKRKIKKNETQD